MDRIGPRITVATLQRILDRLPPGCIEPVIISRVAPILSVSMPTGAIPTHWDAVAHLRDEVKIDGYIRIRYIGDWK